VTLDQYLDHLMSILTDEAATDAEQDGVAKLLLSLLHEEVGRDLVVE
jgi:hypothetical protein